MKKRRMIIGIDEVGRGALAGPLYVAALLMPRGLRLRKKSLAKLRDSKRLSPKQREEWLEYLEDHPEISFAVSSVSPGVVDRKNVARAANLAAGRALRGLIKKEGVGDARVYLDGGLFVDNKFLSEVNYKLTPKTLIKGDERINAIKLASIVAKVKRDEYMVKLHEKHPKYDFHRHKGYGTKFHKRAIKRHGVSEVHRSTFIQVTSKTNMV